MRPFIQTPILVLKPSSLELEEDEKPLNMSAAMSDDDQDQDQLELSPESPHRPSKIARFEEQEDARTETEEKEVENRRMVQNPNPRNVQRYLVAIEYVGTSFSGAQQQAPRFRTVVGVLQVVIHSPLFSIKTTY